MAYTSYHASMYITPSRLYFLGLPVGSNANVSCWSASLLSWKERIDAYTKQGDWLPGLSLALDFYEGKAKASAGLPNDVASIREVTGAKISELLLAYIDVAINAASGMVEDKTPETQARAMVYFRTLGGICLDYCLTIQRLDLLFTTVFDKFKGLGYSGVFFELLEPYILNNRLTSITPEVIQLFVEYFESKSWLSRVEQCIAHMDPKNLDINQV